MATRMRPARTGSNESPNPAMATRMQPAQNFPPQEPSSGTMKIMVGCLPPGVVQCARTDSWATHTVRPARGARETRPRPRDPTGRRTRPTREGGRGRWRRQQQAHGLQTTQCPAKHPPGAPRAAPRRHLNSDGALREPLRTTTGALGPLAPQRRRLRATEEGNLRGPLRAPAGASETASAANADT